MAVLFSWPIDANAIDFPHGSLLVYFTEPAVAHRSDVQFRYGIESEFICILLVGQCVLGPVPLSDRARVIASCQRVLFHEVIAVSYMGYLRCFFDQLMMCFAFVELDQN